MTLLSSYIKEKPSFLKIKFFLNKSYLMTTRLGGELQQPITGSTFGWENILYGEKELKKEDLKLFNKKIAANKSILSIYDSTKIL